MPAMAADHVTDRAPLDATITFFYYDDLPAAAAFYEDLLGLDKTMNAEWVKIYRITSTSSVGLVQNGKGYHSVSEDKPAMLSIVTDDVDAWYTRLSAADVTILSELRPADVAPSPDSAPVRGFIVADPGGYTVEFFTWQNPSRQ